jgi:arabinose-5-phosphate isomerase
MPNETSNPTTPASFVRVEAAALTALAQRLDTTMLAPFTQAIDRILASPNRVIVTGIGKSGIIARKLAATLRST